MSLSSKRPQLQKQVAVQMNLQAVMAAAAEKESAQRIVEDLSTFNSQWRSGLTITDVEAQRGDETQSDQTHNVCVCPCRCVCV